MVDLFEKAGLPHLQAVAYMALTGVKTARSMDEYENFLGHEGYDLEFEGGEFVTATLVPYDGGLPVPLSDVRLRSILWLAFARWDADLEAVGWVRDGLRGFWQALTGYALTDDENDQVVGFSGPLGDREVVEAMCTTLEQHGDQTGRDLFPCLQRTCALQLLEEYADVP